MCVIKRKKIEQLSAILKDKETEIQNSKSILDYMHGALEVRDEMVRTKEHENAGLKDRIKVLEKQLEMRKQNQASQRDLEYLQHTLAEKDIIIKQLEVRLSQSQESIQVLQSQNNRSSANLASHRYRIKKSGPSTHSSRLTASNLRPSMQLSDTFRPAPLLSTSLNSQLPHQQADPSSPTKPSPFHHNGRVTIGRADTVAEAQAGQEHSHKDSPAKERKLLPTHAGPVASRTFVSQNTKISFQADHLVSGATKRPFGGRQSTMVSSPQERSNLLTRRSMIELVTPSQGLKRVETIFNTNYGAKPLITMSKQEIEDCINSPELLRVQELFQNESTLMRKMETMLPTERREVCFMANCVLNDLVRCCRFINRIRRQISAYNKILDDVPLENTFSVIGEQICSLLDCEKAEIYLLDDRSQFLFTAKGTSVDYKKFPWQEGILGQACSNKKITRLDDVLSDPRFDATRDRYVEDIYLKNLLCVPVYQVKAQKSYGACIAYNKKDGNFTAEDEALLVLMARQSGLVMKQALTAIDLRDQKNRSKAMIAIAIECLHAETLTRLSQIAQKYFKELICASEARIWFASLDDKTIFCLEASGETIIHSSDTGIVGKTRSTHTKDVVTDSITSPNYNTAVDIRTELPLVTIPVPSVDGLRICGVVQFVHMKSFFYHESHKRNFFELEMIDSFLPVLAHGIERLLGRATD